MGVWLFELPPALPPPGGFWLLSFPLPFALVQQHELFSGIAPGLGWLASEFFASYLGVTWKPTILYILHASVFGCV